MGAIGDFFSRIGCVPKLLKDKEVKWWKKAIVIAAILYFILPIDIIPLLLGPLGLIDDVIIWIVITNWLKKDFDKYRYRSTKVKEGVDLSRKYKKKNVVEATFTVDSEDITAKNADDDVRTGAEQTASSASSDTGPASGADPFASPDPAAEPVKEEV